MSSRFESHSSPLPSIEPVIVTDVACPVCGCVCDDLELTLAGERVIETRRACPLAEHWFEQQTNSDRPAAQMDGVATSLEEALSRAATILSQSRAPLIYGLSRSSTPGQRAAVALADRLGAIVDTTASLCHGPSIMAVQSVGESTCSLGEIRNRADLVIYWGCDPAVSHPRHAERYSVFPRGQFVSGGRSDRTVVMIGDASSVQDWRLDRAGSRPDIVVPIEPGRDFEAITALRCLLRGLPVNADPTDQRLIGANLEVLTDLVERMRNCRCGVVFFGLGLTETSFGQSVRQTNLGHHNVGNLLRLVAELNAVTRFHARRMRLQGDVSGADSVLCWQTGFPFGVDFSRGYPRYNPGEFTANDLLERGEPDACLLVGSETVPFFSEPARQHLARIPTISLDYPAATPFMQPTIAITTSVYGLHAAGTVYRMDETPIPLRQYLRSAYATDAEVLDALRRRM